MTLDPAKIDDSRKRSNVCYKNTFDTGKGVIGDWIKKVGVGKSKYEN